MAYRRAKRVRSMGARMRNISKRMLLLLLAIVPVAPTRLLAQDVWGNTSMYYDWSSGSVVAFCETETDYDTTQYYQPGVDCAIRDSSGVYVADTSDWSYAGSFSATATTYW